MPKSKYTQKAPSVHELDKEDDIISQPELQPETEVSAKMLPQKNASVSGHRKTSKKKKKKKKKNSKGSFSQIFSTLSSKIARGIRQSAVARALTSHEMVAEAFRKTWLYGLFFSEKNTERINRAKVKFRRNATDAVIPKLLGRACSSLLTVKSRIYGLILFMFGLTLLTIHYLINAKFQLFIYDSYAPLTAGCICVTALLFLFSNSSLSQDIYESKFLGSVIFDIMGVNRYAHDTEEAADLSSLGACALGIMLGALTMIFPASSILLFILLAIYAMIVTKSPEVGMISVILMTPFAPLKIINVAVILLALSYFLKILYGKRTLKLEFSDIPVALFMLTVLSAQAVSFGGIGRPLTTFVIIMLYFITVSILRSEVWFNRAIHALAVCVSLISIGALALYLVDRFVNVGIFSDFSFEAYRETFSHMLLFSIFILLALIFKSENRKTGFGLLLILACAITYLCFTLPATALLAALTALVIFLLLYNTKTVFAILPLGALWAVLAKFIPRLNIIAKINTNKGALTNSNLIIGLLSKFGFEGIGSADSAPDVLHSSASVGSGTAIIEEGNLFLSLALELGYIGLAMFVISFFFILQNAFSYGQGCTDRRDRYRIISYASMSGLISAFIYGFWENTLTEPRMMLIYWLLAGITVSGSRCVKEQSAEYGQDIPSDCY